MHPTFALCALVSCLALFPLQAHASAAPVDGRLTFRITADNGSGEGVVEVRQEGSRILGQNTFSNDWGVDLSINAGQYQGSAAGGYTDLSCNASSCSGEIGDKSAHFDFAPTGMTGVCNFEHLQITRSAGHITIRSYDTLELTQTAPGQYEGHGFWNNRPASASLTTSGTLQDVQDPALLVILLGSPFAHQ